ncbi:MAG: phosphatidate cytidylyltransferase [Acidimicrobiales bacterium]
MAENDEHTAQPPRPPGEGIRIIGAEEAASALESGAAERRRPADAPRFGDVPQPPQDPRAPDLRFPLEEDDDAYAAADDLGGTRVEPPPGSRPAVGGPPPEMQHWTEPATGEVPAIFPGQPAPEETAYPGFTRAPRWRAAGEDWGETELGDPSELADDETRVGALDTSRTEHSDMFEFEEEAPTPDTPRRIQTRSSVEPPRPHAVVRDNRQATIIGVALGALFLILAAAGPKFLLVLVAGVVVALTAELYAVLRRAGYKPATLLGLVASLSMVFGSYWKGERAVLLVVVLTVLFTFFWYLAGVVHARPTVNIAATLLVFAWAGVLGSFAGLLLRPSGLHGHSRDGIAFLLGVVLCVVVNDVVAYVAGQAFGRTPLAPSVSPGKTVEGFVIALVATVLTGTAVVGHIHPFGPVKGFWLGLVLSVVAPLGDLCESMVKRDIGLKDMGAALPGHGGLADRFDGLLFALPAAYYLFQILKVGTL